MAPSEDLPTVTVDAAEQPASRRERRLEKLANSSNLSFTVEPAVRRLLERRARAEGMNLTHYMQKLVETHVIETAPADDALARRLAAKRQVIAQTVALATRMEAEGGFDENFILKVVQRAAQDPDFGAQYTIATTGGTEPDSRRAARARVSLNQQIGRVIKKAVGARSKRGASGKIVRAQVENELISTYTLLEKAA